MQKLNLIVLKLTHLEHLVNEGEQMVCGDVHLFLVLANQFDVVGVRAINLKQANDAVERRANIVAHAA